MSASAVSLDEQQERLQGLRLDDGDVVDGKIAADAADDARSEVLEDDAAVQLANKNPQQFADDQSKPTSVLVIGMAGSGKTTLMKRMNAWLKQYKRPAYVVNLDPAVLKTQYPCNIDIRDSVDYKKIMHQYELGPNGGIMTALNLFATRFDQVMDFIEKKNLKPPKEKKPKKEKKSKKSKSAAAESAESAEAKEQDAHPPSEEPQQQQQQGDAPPRRGLDYVLLDTPGQIEIFTWSASGTIITDSLASSFPSVVLYVVDTPRNANPATFMSNMMYACSIMYKTKLPLLVVFNKTDVMGCQFAQEWMADFEKFCDALNVDSSSHMSDLTRSMSLVLDEFYAELSSVGVSSLTGAGMKELFAAIDNSRQEYFESYLPMLEFRKQEAVRRKEELRQKELSKYRKSRGQRGEEEVALAARRAGAAEAAGEELDEDDAGEY